MAIDNTGAQLSAQRSAWRRRPWQAVSILLASLSLAGCGSRDTDITPATIDADVILFERGSEALEAEDWTRAREYFIQIRDNYPQSALRADARLGVGDTFEGQGSADAYVQAVAEFRDFLSLYPTHPRAPYAQYKLGLVYYRQMRRPERDQTETREAAREFEVFIQQYPTSDLIGEVRAKLREVRDRLSESDFVVGRFYYRNNWYPGAIDRFRAILDSDPGYTGRDAVYFHLADALRATNEAAEALPLFERLVEEFPDTEYLEQATERIAELKQEMALQDQENR